MNEKKVRKIAQCIQTLLEDEGILISVKKVVEVINSENLSNISNLKEKVKNTLSNNSNITSSDRRNYIESYAVKNWSQIRDDKELEAYYLMHIVMGVFPKINV